MFSILCENKKWTNRLIVTLDNATKNKLDTLLQRLAKKYDLEIGINSSPIHLKSYTKITIQICYLLTSIFLGAAVLIKDANYLFWPIWLITSILMQRDTLIIFKTEDHSISKVSIHFRNQVIYGGLFLLGFIISN